MDKEIIKKNNESIKRAILVSQMQEHTGFKVFMEDFEITKNSIKNPDIDFIKDMSVLENLKGQLRAMEALEHYFATQNNWAMKPLIDEETGEEEILNKK